MEAWVISFSQLWWSLQATGWTELTHQSSHPYCSCICPVNPCALGITPWKRKHPPMQFSLWGHNYKSHRSRMPNIYPQISFLLGMLAIYLNVSSFMSVMVLLPQSFSHLQTTSLTQLFKLNDRNPLGFLCSPKKSQMAGLGNFTRNSPKSPKWFPC